MDTAAVIPTGRQKKRLRFKDEQTFEYRKELSTRHLRENNLTVPVILEAFRSDPKVDMLFGTRGHLIVHMSGSTRLCEVSEHLKR